MIITAFAIFFDGCKTVKSNETLPQNQEISQAAPTATSLPQQIPQMEIKSDEVISLALETVYKDYFDENSKCRKTYNEFFGESDGVYSPSSPCTINLSFARDGSASKIVHIRRYDKKTQEFQVIESSVWTGKISDEQFDGLAHIITENQAFRNWQEGTMLYARNSKVSAKHPKGMRTVMSNVDKSATQFLPMIDSFKQLDKEVKWEKAQ